MAHVRVSYTKAKCTAAWDLLFAHSIQYEARHKMCARSQQRAHTAHT